MNPVISVIIPIYNVEKYLEKSLKSVVNQTYTHLEIILINDGSTDRCFEICNRYKKKDARIKVIHKENKGLSDARNVGMKIAKGKYVFFLDSDDWIESETLSRLILIAETENCEIVQSNFYYSFEEKENLGFDQIEDIKFYNNYSGMEALVKNEEIKNFAWGKLYLRELVMCEKFPVGKLFEDAYWAHHIFGKTHKIASIKEPFLHYLQRNDSISFNISKNNLDLLYGMEERKKYLKKEYPDLVIFLEVNLIKMALGIHEAMAFKGASKDYQYCVKEIKKILSQIDLTKNSLITEEIKKRINEINDQKFIFRAKVIYRKLINKIRNRMS